MPFSKLSILIFLLSFTAITQAQNIQSPEAFLPTNYGERFTPHHLLVDYFKYVADQNEQVILQEYGKTYEKRPLIYAIISSPENMQRLETIRTDNLKRAGLIDGSPSSTPPVAIVWLSYGVHGNEAGASESSMAVLHALAQPDAKMKALLEKAVVILDPCINPDGYSRYTHWNWNVTNLTPDPHPIAREHREPWPGGRVNHYLFDLNRDWAWHTQVETQQRLDVYQQWMPHVHVDYHEMGHNSPYYFAPAAQPYHEYITKWQGEFQHEVGKNHAGYFDENGWLYYTREIFDLFYPSYGDTYPIFNGAIGMTHEQAGHGMAGCAILQENEDTLKIQDRIDHHLATSLSNIEISAKNAQQLSEKFTEYFEKTSSNPPGQYKSFVIPASNHPDKVKALCRFLDKHQIRYGRVSKDLKKQQAYNYATGQEESINIASEDLIISAYQPKAVLTQVLFEPQPFLVDSLTYDITAWALPHAYGLQAYALTNRLKAAQSFTPMVYAKPAFPKTAYAYLSPWGSLEDARFLGQLLQKNIKVRYATKAFSLDGQEHPAGTLVINLADNQHHPNFDQTVQQLAVQNERQLHAVQSGFSTKGYDLGSDKMHLIAKPRIAILQNDQTLANEFGQVWYYFEQNLGYPVTVIRDLNGTKLDKFNLLVLPEGYFSLDTDKLKSWMRNGGRTIAIGRALRALKDKDGFALNEFATDGDKAKAKKAKEKEVLDSRLNTYGHRERASLSDYIPGAIFRVKMDTTHPLAFGLPDYYFSLKTSSNTYQWLKKSWNVGYLEDKPMYLGFIGNKVKKRMDETTVFAVQSMGKGSVIYLVDNPLFRGFWEQGKCLFSNAVFIAGQ